MLTLIAPYSPEQLETAYNKLMSPLVWDLGHIAAFEELWLVHRYGGQPLSHPELSTLYDAFETPRAVRGDADLFNTAEALEYLADVRERGLKVLDELGPGDGHLFEMVIQHELQHTETMLQAIEMAHLPQSPEVVVPLNGHTVSHDPFECTVIPEGTCEVGADGSCFYYDNEYPAHRISVPEFEIARCPVSNEAFVAFIENDGYGRRELWTDAGWEWLQQNNVRAPGEWEQRADGWYQWRIDGWHRLELLEPVIHISWFEADAFARANGARLPTEEEWEKAAKHAQLELVGDVWEWTASNFDGYPGFTAYPYPEYSEVFFDSGYKVLRGGSWATSKRVGTRTFRNWDLPERRQIFAGVRLAF